MINYPIMVPMCEQGDISTYNHWIPITPIEDMERKDYDVIIVGSGAGGGAVAWRLAEQWRGNGKRIGVVEAGNLFLPTHAKNIATMEYERVPAYFSSPYVSVRPPDYQSSKLIAFGGRTLFWGGTSPRMPVSEIVRWPVKVNEMAFYYDIAESIMHVSGDFAKGSSFTEILLNRLQKDGFSDAMYEPMAVDLRPTSYGRVRTNAFFSSIVFFAQAMNQHPFDLAIKAPITRVFVEQGKVSGVEVATIGNKSHYLKAKTVVLCASATGSPRILLQSGITGGAIGHYLTNHSRVVGFAGISRSEFPEELGVLHILIPGNEDRPYQIQIQGSDGYNWRQYQEIPVRNDLSMIISGSAPIESRFENYVFLDPLRRDSYGMPILRTQFSISEMDAIVINRLAAGIREATDAMKSSLNSICFALPGLESHEMGTCRMGDDPATSATNRFGQIHGISGLFVADNSVIPTSGTANPVLTTVALAIRTADYIISQMK